MKGFRYFPNFVSCLEENLRGFGAVSIWWLIFFMNNSRSCNYGQVENTSEKKQVSSNRGSFKSEFSGCKIFLALQLKLGGSCEFSLSSSLIISLSDYQSVRIGNSTKKRLYFHLYFWTIALKEQMILLGADNIERILRESILCCRERTNMSDPSQGQ